MDFMLPKKEAISFSTGDLLSYIPSCPLLVWLIVLRGVESAEAFLDFPLSSIIIGEPRLSLLKYCVQTLG